MKLSHIWTRRENGNHSEIRYEIKSEYNSTATTQIVDVKELGCYDNGEYVNIYPHGRDEKNSIEKLIIDKTTNHAIQILKNGDVGGSFEITFIG